MSWGALLMDLPKGMTINEISEKYGDDWQPQPIGSRLPQHWWARVTG
jgi:hypothetical protein